MTTTLHKVGAYLAVALGVAHLLFTFVAYDRFTHNALWFVGTGFAVVFAGFLNVAAMRAAAGDRLTRSLSLFADATLFLLFAAALRILLEPQVWFGAGLFLMLSVLTGRDLFANKHA